MDSRRRKLILAASGLPMTWVLTGCGGGGTGDGAETSIASSRATAASAKPSSGAYLEFARSPKAQSLIDTPPFRASLISSASDALQFLVPAKQYDAVITANGDLHVRITEVISVKGVTHLRCLTLLLPAYPAQGGAKTYTIGSGGALGTVTVNSHGDTADVVTHYDYTLTSGTITATRTASETVNLGFNAVTGSKTINQTFHSDSADVTAKLIGNSGAYPFAIQTAANLPIAIQAKVETTGAWI